MIDYEAFLSRGGARLQASAIRQMGTVAAQLAQVISFAPGYPAPDTFAWEAYGEIASRLLARDADHGALQYGPTRGYPPLLDAIRGVLERRGIDARGDELQVTTGSQQGLDLVARVLVDPGDVVLVELPSYTGAIAAFRNAQAQLVGVRQDQEGPDPDHLDTVLREQRALGRRVKFLYVIPNFQNPTGLLMSPARRQTILEWADRRDMLIVEDDPYGELYFEAERPHTRPLKADDRSGRVVYLSTFSKTLAPAFRVAWVAGPAPLVARFETAKQAIDLCTSNLDQRIVYEACRTGVLDRQAPILRDRYRLGRDVMERALRDALGDRLSWKTPRGGFFIWAQLAGDLDAQAVLTHATRHGVIYVAGRPFFVDDSGTALMRLAFSYVGPEGLEEGVRRLAAAISEVSAAAPEHPSRSPREAEPAPTPVARGEASPEGVRPESR